MEYILFLTYRCNLNCKYCFAKNLVHDDKNNASITQSNIDNVCRYIEKDIKINDRKDNSIVFFGGEPSLVPDIISSIISKTAHLNLNYSIYTNGLLLDKFPENLLKKFQSILVAIDGDKKSHELYKPMGSYDEILKNVNKIRNKTNAQIIARITMEEHTNIYYSVKNLVDKFDFVHWQVVNKESFDDPQKLVNDYQFNIKKLFDFWKDNLKIGKILNIIPFNRIVLSILNEEKVPSFRCGCGSTIQAIDIDGNIYSCDEYIENKNNAIGNIDDDKYNLICYKSHLDLYIKCKSCEVSSICLGRCRKALETQSAEHIDVYCSLTKILINMILESIDEIKQIISEQKIDLNRFHTEIYNTEIIP